MVNVVKGSPEAHKVGTPSTRPDWTESDCRPFTHVTHTTHVIPAIDVLRTGKLSPGLVYDDSHLNKHRIAVVWVSPNHWSTGYRYGNVQFAFPFAALAAGRRAYWVQIAEYKIPAPRILLTDQNRDGHPDLTPYDPAQQQGPWWFDGTTHYFNGDNVCVEFMVEGDLPAWSEITFVDHHSSFCCMHRTAPSTCRELGVTAEVGACRFLARIVSEGIDVSRTAFDQQELAWKRSSLLIRTARPKATYGGSITATDPGADTFARAVFAAYATYHDADRDGLLSVFASHGDAEASCRRVLAAALGRTEAQLTPDD